MTPPPGSLQARLAALALALVVLAVIGLGVVRPIAAAYGETGRRIETLRRDLGRLAAGAERAEARRRSLERLEKDGAIRDLALASASEGAATARLQERLVGIVESAGGRIITVQALPQESGKGLGRITLRLQFSADTPQLRAILHGLEYGRPVVLLENVFVHSRTARAVGAGQSLTVRLDVHAFLVKEG